MLSSLDGVESNTVARFQDYTVASSFEELINEIEFGIKSFYKEK